MIAKSMSQDIELSGYTPVQDSFFVPTNLSSYGFLMHLLYVNLKYKTPCGLTTRHAGSHQP